MAAQLSKAQSILLAVHYASETRLPEFEALCALKHEYLTDELALRILLTYLPEVTPPSQYTPLVDSLVSKSLKSGSAQLSLDTSEVDELSDATADKRLRHLTLQPLSPPSWPSEAPSDILTRFICHRAYLIDEETGLSALVLDLITPFINQSEYLRLWFLSAVLPLVRLRKDFYPDSDIATDLTYAAFEKIDGQHGVELLLSGAGKTEHEIVGANDCTGTIARDLKGAVGPWLYGHNARKRRRLSSKDGMLTPGLTDNRETLVRATSFASPTEYSWEHVYKWLARRAVHDFATAVAAFEDWDGPVDVDVNDLVSKDIIYNKAEQDALMVRYCQSGLAICYAVTDNTSEAVAGAHTVLARLAMLLNFEPPPDLATSVEQLPKVDDHISDIEETDDESVLEVERLMGTEHPLTKPTLASFMFLEMLVYSAYQLSGLGHQNSIVNITKMRMFSTAEEQLKVLQTILHERVQKGKRDQTHWQADIGRINWLWGWNIVDQGDGNTGAGALGKIPRETLDRELVMALLATGNFGLVDRLYIRREDTRHKLSDAALEDAILAEAMQCYDNASNGNRTRGNMKKAHDILSSFRLTYPSSQGFDRAIALVAATHAMSFYSLTLQHGVPFKPINIRVANDPLSLIEQILDQNKDSYTQLEDLLTIGRNLTIASPGAVQPTPGKPLEKSALLLYSSRRIILASITAALSASDFDTAYSYLTSRLSPSTTPDPSDDISWRAAFLAGRHRPASALSLRALEQRMELLSLALLLAPPSALTEILSVYRRAEEEVSALAAADADADHAADAGRRSTDRPATVPGGFDALGVTEGRTYNQTSRSGAGRAPTDAPVGLFDLARGAAGAITRNAFPLRTKPGETPAAAQDDEGEAWGWQEGDDDEAAPRGSSERVRKRDMVASAVTGSLASGIGWVLGATPVEAPPKR